MTDLETIYREYGPLVSKVTRRMLLKKEIAAEAAQEVWMEIMKSLPSFKGESELSTWIYTIAKRVALKYGQNEFFVTDQMRDAYLNLDEVPCPVENPQEKQAWVKEQCDTCLTASLHCLTNEDRLCFVLKELAGLSYAETALVMDKDEAAVRKIISRARTKIKNFYLQDCVIFNPKGKCRCRIRTHARAVNLEAIYRTLNKTVKNIMTFKKLDKITEIRNFWESVVNKKA